MAKAMLKNKFLYAYYCLCGDVSFTVFISPIKKSDNFLHGLALLRQTSSHFSHLAARPTITIYTSRLYFDAITLAQVRSEISEETAWVTQNSNGSQASI